jgi:hypothetical protein
VPATPTPAAQAAAKPSAPREVLPRAVAAVDLGMSQAEAQLKLGTLRCHEGDGGLKVCAAEREPIGLVHHLEIYLYGDRVISLAYEIDIPPNAWNFIDRQIERYGNPSLSGQRTRDKVGRDHEVFGWKDDSSLYSVRLVWGIDVGGSRRLLGTNIALWDRPAYQAWEEQESADDSR